MELSQQQHKKKKVVKKLNKNALDEQVVEALLNPL